IRELRDFATPPEVYTRLTEADIRLVDAVSADLSAILAFEARHFPAWLRYYEMVIETGAHEDIVLAKNADGAIVGTSYVLDFRDEIHRHDFVWQELLGSDTGGVGPLGVAEEWRGK